MSTLNTTNIKHAGNTGKANLVLASDGTSTFNNDVTIDGDLSAAAGTFSDNTTIGGTTASPNITLNADGSAEFSGNVTTSGNLIFGSWGIRVTDPGTGAVGKAWEGIRGTTATSSIDSDGTLKIGGTLPSNPNISLSPDGRGIFKAGTGTSRVDLWTEPDNPANFNAEGEYTGPTLDVKDRVLNLISRLDALEANEVIDDATDVSLLQLVASATTRLDSIEARLTALEGGN